VGQGERDVLLTEKKAGRCHLAQFTESFERMTTGASPNVGSSRMNRVGCIISGRAIASICCSPRERMRATCVCRDATIMRTARQVERGVQLQHCSGLRAIAQEGLALNTTT
jgi:hypothetical protein